MTKIKDDFNLSKKISKQINNSIPIIKVPKYSMPNLQLDALDFSKIIPTIELPDLSHITELIDNLSPILNDVYRFLETVTESTHKIIESFYENNYSSIFKIMDIYLNNEISNDNLISDELNEDIYALVDKVTDKVQKDSVQPITQNRKHLTKEDAYFIISTILTMISLLYSIVSNNQEKVSIERQYNIQINVNSEKDIDELNAFVTKIDEQLKLEK